MPMKCTNNSQRTDLEDCNKQTLPNTWHAFYSFSGKAMEFLFGHFSIPMIREEVRASIQFHPTSTSIPCFLENALEVFRVLGDQLFHWGPQNQLVQMNILTPEPNTKIWKVLGPMHPESPIYHSLPVPKLLTWLRASFNGTTLCNEMAQHRRLATAWRSNEDQIHMRQFLGDFENVSGCVSSLMGPVTAYRKSLCISFSWFCNIRLKLGPKW